MTPLADVLPFPKAPEPDRDPRLLAGTLARLYTAPFAVYHSDALPRHGIPSDILEHAFPLYSFSKPPNHYIASVVSASLVVYPAVEEHLRDDLRAVPTPSLRKLTHLGAIALALPTLEERLSVVGAVLDTSLEEQIPTKDLNFLLWDLLYVHLGKAVEYGNKIVPVHKKTRPNDPEQQRKQEFVMEYMFLVKRIAYQIAVRLPRSVEVDDLISEGWIGFFDAVEKYDASKSYNFGAYASIRVRGAILDSLRALDDVSRSVREVLNTIEEAQHQLRGLHPEKDITLDDAFAEAGVSRERYEDAVQSAPTVSLFSDLGHDNNGLLAPVAIEERVSDGRPTPDDDFHDHAREATLRRAIQQLEHPNDRVVVELYHFTDLNFREIGAILGVTESRICQIHMRAMQELGQMGSVQELHREL